jgi:hypothetical protein
MPPGSVEGLQMVVADAEASRQELADSGVDVSDVQVSLWGPPPVARTQKPQSSPDAAVGPAPVRDWGL